MTNTAQGFINAYGKKIHTHSWPVTQARAQVVIVHGLGEHGGRYSELASSLNQRGYSCYALDHQGHGKSEGEPGFIESFAIFVDTAADFIERVKAQAPDLPCIMIGHSMGGVIASNLLIDHPGLVDICALSGPALATDDAIGPLQRRLLKGLAVLLPKARVFSVDPTLVSSDPATVAAYRNDPLVLQGKGCVKLITEILNAAGRALERADAIRIPMLFMHGGADALAHPNGSVRMHDAIASTDKDLVIYPDLYHEIFNEPCRQDIFTELGDWLDQHLSPPN